MITLETLNQWPTKTFEAELLKCCGSKAWVLALEKARPFSGEAQLFEAASRIWKKLTPKDWKEAFSHHPKIGDVESLRKKFSSTSTWASQEQSGVASADESILRGLAQGNERYEKKFGFVFLICATGKSASEMLEALNKRIDRTAEEELNQAVEEQNQIMRIRLKKLFGGSS